MLPNQMPQFNPDGSLMRRHQLRLVEIMKEFDNICQRHNLKYWLAFGTLLGAVRHGGFIPWDDDADVEMPMEDYKKLLKILPKELPEHLVLQDDKTDPAYFNTYAKLRDLRSILCEPLTYDRLFKYRGIYIDIFPVEKTNKLLHWISLRTHCFCYKTMVRNKHSDACRLKIMRSILHINLWLIFPVLRALSKIVPGKLFSALGVPDPSINDRSTIYPLKKISFEGFEFMAPNDPHTYLSSIYGDYMKLPNLNDLHPHVMELNLDL